MIPIGYDGTLLSILALCLCSDYITQYQEESIVGWNK